MSSRFIIGDELGNIKSLRVSSDKDASTTVLKTFYQPKEGDASGAVQKLAAVCGDDGNCLFAASFAAGKSLVGRINRDSDDSSEILAEWNESRITNGRFVGLSIHRNFVFSCTANGALRKTSFASDDWTNPSSTQYAALPSRLNEWKSSADASTFCYGGEEVDISVWDTSLAFDAPSAAEPSNENNKKRKRKKELLPGETWRARNLSNDSLNLRRPIRITSLDFDSSSSGHGIIAGTQFGEVHRYDTRSGRRPVATWSGIGRVGGVGIVRRGLHENELFASDKGHNLSSVDLRNGRVLYSYKGIAGAVTTIAQSPTILMSTAMDRYARSHTVAPPPKIADSNMDARGEVRSREYLTTTPTASVWDQVVPRKPEPEKSGEDDEEIWENMEHIS